MTSAYPCKGGAIRAGRENKCVCGKNEIVVLFFTNLKVGGGKFITNYRYQAFISYSHEDEAVAARLHQALEAYSVPKYLHDKYSRKISPIFRDVTELTAHHSLSDKIKEAVLQSRYLIVLCSPAAKNSHWVNEEIKLFRGLHGEGSILSALVKGSPETSFPAALIEDGREPLAANLSQKNFRLGVSQLAASILGVGLDELVQRDLKKMRQRVIAVTASALGALLVMGTLTGVALNARQEADARRGDAEGLIEFMLTDLKDKLEPVGRLDVLETVGTKASEYYEGHDLSDHDDDALGRRARVHHFLGEISYAQGYTKASVDYYNKAYTSTETLLARSPDDADRIYEHSKSAVARATPIYFAGNFDEAKPLIQDYIDLANRLNQIEPDSERGLKEPGEAYQNMAILYYKQSEFDKSKSLFEKSYTFKQQLTSRFPENEKYKTALGNVLAWSADNALLLGQIKKSRDFRAQETSIYEALLKDDPRNKLVELQLSRTLLGLARIEMKANKPEAALGYFERAISIKDTLRKFDPSNNLSNMRYLDASQQEIKYLIKLSRFEQAEEKLGHLKSILSSVEILSEGKTPGYIYMEQQNAYLEVIINILTDRIENARIVADKYLSDNGNMPVDISADVPIFLTIIKAVMNTDIATLNDLISRHEEAGRQADDQYMRITAIRKSLSGDTASMDAYLSKETDFTLKQVYANLLKPDN